MLNQFVNILQSTSHENIVVNGDSFSINNHSITDLHCLQTLENNQCITEFRRNGNIVYFNDLRNNEIISIEFSLLHLKSIGYYENFATFLQKNKYSIPNSAFYIREIDCFSNDSNLTINIYQIVVALIDAIKKNAKHCYTEANIDYSVIFREDTALFLPFLYDYTDIKNIKNEEIEKIKLISLAFECNDTDNKKLLYINELIEYLSVEEENKRFEYLLAHISEFSERANNAYQYYIRNFSYNKLKSELDNAALEYSKKIQSVINEAQTKLIAIPTAFTIATASIDFEKIVCAKNIGIIISLFIFAILIELFIRNQKSALRFIQQNIDVYKSTFKSMNEIVKKSFEVVDIEWKKQNKRICIIKWITWIIPFLILIILIILFFSQNTITQWYNQIIQ